MILVAPKSKVLVPIKLEAALKLWVLPPKSMMPPFASKLPV